MVHSLAPVSASRSAPSGSTFTQPRRPDDPAARGPPAPGRSGAFFDNLLPEPRRGRRELRALRLPVLQAFHVHAQRLAPLGRLRVVEADALDELALRRAAKAAIVAAQ